MQVKNVCAPIFKLGPPYNICYGTIIIRPDNYMHGPLLMTLKTNSGNNCRT